MVHEKSKHLPYKNKTTPPKKDTKKTPQNQTTHCASKSSPYIYHGVISIHIPWSHLRTYTMEVKQQKKMQLMAYR